jgi:chlorophyllide a reductase subunit Z
VLVRISAAKRLRDQAELSARRTGASIVTPEHLESPPRTASTKVPA